MWQEVRKQTRRAEVAEKRLNLLQKSLEETEDANIRLEATNLTLQSDNERLRALLIEAKAGVAVLSRPGVEYARSCHELFSSEADSATEVVINVLFLLSSRSFRQHTISFWKRKRR